MNSKGVPETYVIPEVLSIDGEWCSAIIVQQALAASCYSFIKAYLVNQTFLLFYSVLEIVFPTCDIIMIYLFSLYAGKQVENVVA